MSTPIRSRASLLALVIPVTFAVSACFGSSTPTPAATTEPTAAATATPAPTVTPTPLVTPTANPTATTEPSESPSASPGASASPGTIDASICTGTAQNKDFFAAAATAEPWTVYCAVLPAGWSVTTGEYRLSSGGRLAIAYKGPSGATLAISEGAFCTSGVSSCSPRDSTIGDASFGDLPGTLVNVSGGFALYVGPGSTTAYQATGTGMDESAFRALASSLHKLVPQS